MKKMLFTEKIFILLNFIIVELATKVACHKKGYPLKKRKQSDGYENGKETEGDRKTSEEKKEAHENSKVIDYP